MATRLGERVRGLVEFDALLLTAALWFLAKFLRYAFPPLFPTFGTEFAVSNTLLGTAFTVMMTVYAAMQFPSGALADRLGAVTVVVAGAGVAAAGALALVVSLPFAALVGGMVLVGLGTGAHKTVAVRLLSRTYPAQTGRALGVLDTFGAFGGVVAPAAVVAVTARADWHALFLLGGLAGLLLAVAFAVRAPRRVPPPTAASETETALRAYLRLFADGRFSAFVGVTLCFSFAYNGVVAFLPLYLTEQAGLSGTAASLLYSVLFLVSLVQLVTGDLSDRVGRLPVIGVTLGLAAVASIALVAAGADTSAVGEPAVLAVDTGAVRFGVDRSLLSLGTIVVVLGLGSHGFRPVRGAYLSAVIPESVAGGGLGVVRTLLMGAGAVAPAVVGVVSDRRGFTAAFTLLAASMTLAVLLVAVVGLLDRSTAADTGEE
ncbi:MAG: MFS transporter [Halobaculum sp.]